MAISMQVVVGHVVCFVFFFSSRRRHTRSDRDWSFRRVLFRSKASFAPSRVPSPTAGSKWHQWEPAVGDGTREGAKLAFGSYLNTVYRPEKADVILSLDSDFLGSGPGHIPYAKKFSRSRKLNGPEDTMKQLLAVRAKPDVTG